MISEQELAKLSYPEAPKILTEKIPGPKGHKIIDASMKYQTPTRVGGMVLPYVWDEARGATVKDPDGNIVINMTGGVAVNIVGQCHPKVVEAVREQATKIMHTVDMVSTRNEELAEKLSDLMPQGLRGNCFTAYATSGSGATETAIKFSRYMTGKSQIVAFQGAYHGCWYGSMALTCGEHYRLGFGPKMPDVVHVPYAYCYRCPFRSKYPECGLLCADYVDYVLNTPYTGVDDVAAVIVEPLQGEGGYVPPPPGWLKKIEEVCRKNGCLFIVDEVQCGVGRTGKLWDCEYEDVKPDMLVWAKGVGGDMPLGGVTMRSDFRDKLGVAIQPVTFTANAVICAVALTNLEIITDARDDLMGRAVQVGEEIKRRINDAAKDSKVIGDVRGRGFMIAIELVKDKATKEPVASDVLPGIMMKMRDRGFLTVLCGRYGNAMRFMPALVITREYFNKAVDAFLDIVKEGEAEWVK